MAFYKFCIIIIIIIIIIINQPNTKSNPNHNPNRPTKQHATVRIQQNVVSCPMYSEKFVQGNAVSPFVCFCWQSVKFGQFRWSVLPSDIVVIIGVEARDVLSKTSLPVKTLAQIWYVCSKFFIWIFFEYMTEPVAGDLDA